MKLHHWLVSKVLEFPVEHCSFQIDGAQTVGATQIYTHVCRFALFTEVEKCSTMDNTLLLTLSLFNQSSKQSGGANATKTNFQILYIQPLNSDIEEEINSACLKRLN